MKKLLIALFLFTFSSTLFAAHNSEKQAVEKAYYSWCEAISTAKGNAQDVVKYYAPNAILMPTLSEKILRNTNGGLNSYFVHLTNYPNIKCVTKKLITHIEGKIAINSGLYSFTFSEKNGKQEVLPARFTFVYKKIDNKWLIIKHHSSKMPE